MIWYIMIDKSNIWYQPSTQKNKYHQIRPTLHPHHNRGSPKITLNAGIPPGGTKYHQHHQCSNTQHTRNIFNSTTITQCWHTHQHNDISPKITQTCAYLSSDGAKYHLEKFRIVATWCRAPQKLRRITSWCMLQPHAGDCVTSIGFVIVTSWNITVFTITIIKCFMGSIFENHLYEVPISVAY